MQPTKFNRTRIVGIRLSSSEFEQIEKKFRASTCRKLSDYIRRSLFDKPIVTTYRDSSLDDFMTESIRIRNELNNLGNNFNQAVKKLHTLDKIEEFRKWISAFDSEHKVLLNKIEETKNHIQKIAEKWL